MQVSVHGETVPVPSRFVQEIVHEYLHEYTNAAEHAAIQIWASIHRHKGDPTWCYGRDTFGCTVDMRA